MTTPNEVTPTVNTLTVPLQTLKGYTLECYHQGFYPEVGDLKLVVENEPPEGVPVTMTHAEWVTLLRWYRRGYRNNYTKGGTRTGSPYGLTEQGTIYDPLWDALLGRWNTTHYYRRRLPR